MDHYSRSAGSCYTELNNHTTIEYYNTTCDSDSYAVRIYVNAMNCLRLFLMKIYVTVTFRELSYVYGLLLCHCGPLEALQKFKMFLSMLFSVFHFVKI